MIGRQNNADFAQKSKGLTPKANVIEMGLAATFSHVIP